MLAKNHRCAWFRSSARLRSVMSLFVSRIAVGLPRSFSCNDHQLATTN